MLLCIPNQYNSNHAKATQQDLEAEMQAAESRDNEKPSRGAIGATAGLEEMKHCGTESSGKLKAQGEH